MEIVLIEARIEVLQLGAVHELVINNQVSLRN